MSKIFTQLPEELFEHFLWQKATKNQKLGLLVILRRATYQDQRDLKKGQCRISIRQLMVEAEMTKSEVETMLLLFMGLTSRRQARGDMPDGTSALLVGHNVGHNAGREITIYNIMLKGYCEICRTQCRTENQTAFQTLVGHSSDTTPSVPIYDKKLRSLEKEPPSDQIVKTKDLIGGGLFKLGIPKDEADKLFKTWGAEIVFLAYQHITADGYIIETTPIQAMKFACKSKPWEWKTNKPTPESHREKFMNHFEDGKVYNGYQLQLSPSGFAFFCGLTSDGAKFDDPHFSAQMSRVLKRFGIQHPTQIDFKNIKEA